MLPRWFRRRLFARRLSDLKGVSGRLNRGVRVLYFAAREFRRDFCFERAATLAYATIISLIPLAVLFFSFAGQVGAGDSVIAWANEQLIPNLAPDFQAKLSLWLKENVSKNAFAHGLVTLVGLVALLSLILSALGVVVTAERNFDRVWKVKGSRTYLQKLNIFWVVLTTSPFLIATLAKVDDYLVPEGGIIDQITKQHFALQAVYTFCVPAAIGLVGFTVLYYFIPSAQVRLQSAAIGGVFGSVLWVVTRGSFYKYVASTSSLYGSLAILPLFLIWIYVNWAIVLWGCELAYAHQNLVLLDDERDKMIRNRRLRPSSVGMTLLEAVGRAFRAGEGPTAAASVAERLGMIGSEVETVARVLVDRGLLLEDSRRPGRFALAKDPAMIPLSEVLDSLPDDHVDALAHPATGASAAAPESPGDSEEHGTSIVFRGAIAAYRDSFGGRTLADLLAMPERRVVDRPR